MFAFYMCVSSSQTRTLAAALSDGFDASLAASSERSPPELKATSANASASRHSGTDTSNRMFSRFAIASAEIFYFRSREKVFFSTALFGG